MKTPSPPRSGSRWGSEEGCRCRGTAWPPCPGIHWPHQYALDAAADGGGSAAGGEAAAGDHAAAGPAVHG